MCIRDRGNGPSTRNQWDGLGASTIGWTWKTYPERLQEAGVSWKAVSYTHLDVYKRQAVSAAARAASRKREGVREGKAKDMARGIGRAVSRNGRPRRRRCAPAPRRVQLRQGTVPGPRGATRGRARREAGRDAAVWRREMPME